MGSFKNFRDVLRVYPNPLCYASLGDAFQPVQRYIWLYKLGNALKFSNALDETCTAFEGCLYLNVGRVQQNFGGNRCNSCQKRDGHSLGE